MISEISVISSFGKSKKVYAFSIEPMNSGLSQSLDTYLEFLVSNT